MARPSFDPAAFQASLGRVAEGRDVGLENPTPPMDPQLRREHREAAVRGRPIEKFHRALEYHGFRFFPAGTIVNGLPLPEAQWRGVWPELKLKLSFTEDDISSLFAGPEDFDAWVRNQKLVKKLGTRARLVGAR